MCNLSLCRSPAIGVEWLSILLSKLVVFDIGRLSTSNKKMTKTDLCAILHHCEVNKHECVAEIENFPLEESICALIHNNLNLTDLKLSSP